MLRRPASPSGALKYLDSLGEFVAFGDKECDYVVSWHQPKAIMFFYGEAGSNGMDEQGDK